MKKFLNLLSTAVVVVSLGVPLVATVALAILSPTAHTMIAALIVLLVCAIALLIHRGVSAGRKKMNSDTSE
ncbi:hypothetical protein [Hydrogenophaga sp. BPS33]|uniref:hypothetical protein n=1 Tax=Hydrogenophaga sp. BPS33 TaxID=2651974 RepID=UPI00131FE7D2|nr:hypothetical protein [Hydrogenophaga sp. BPS33]QHE86404.1 hypothetical protein F9K07_16590 [Hydrogenophaga sp. BPS33]